MATRFLEWTLSTLHFCCDNLLPVSPKIYKHIKRLYTQLNKNHLNFDQIYIHYLQNQEQHTIFVFALPPIG